MSDDLLKRLENNLPRGGVRDLGLEAAARIRELEAQVERNAAIAINALERATRAEEWRDHDKERAEAAEAALVTARRDALEDAAKLSDRRHQEELALAVKYRGGSNPWFSHCQTAKWHADAATAIRAIAAGGAK